MPCFPEIALCALEMQQDPNPFIALLTIIVEYQRPFSIILRHCQGEAEVGGGDHRVGEGMVRWVVDIFRYLFLLQCFNQNCFTFFLHFFNSLSTPGWRAAWQRDLSPSFFRQNTGTTSNIPATYWVPWSSFYSEFQIDLSATRSPSLRPFLGCALPF